MYCPSCGAPNPDEARFCNQCGTRTAPAPSGETRPGAGPPAPAVITADARTPSTRSMVTGDRVSIPMIGPSRRTMALVAAAIGLGGVALGAFVAIQSIRREDPIPVTPVGLLEEPSPVAPSGTTEEDGGVVVASPGSLRRGPARVAARANTETSPAPSPAPSPGAPPSAATPAAPPATNTARPANAAATGRTTLRTDDAGNVIAYGADGRPLVVLTQGARPVADAGTAATAAADAGGTTPGNVASTGLPPAENGVIERGPRSSVGGYRMGEETDATGHMEDPHVFSFVYRHYSSQIAACHSSASRNRSVSGIMVVRVRVGEDGRVSRTRVVSDSTRDAELQACVQNAIRGWRYPRPVGGDVEVDYPLRFGARSQ